MVALRRWLIVSVRDAGCPFVEPMLSPLTPIRGTESWNLYLPVSMAPPSGHGRSGPQRDGGSGVSASKSRLAVITESNSHDWSWAASYFTDPGNTERKEDDESGVWLRRVRHSHRRYQRRPRHAQPQPPRSP